MFNNRNQDIRNAKGTLPAWIIAERLGIHEKTFYNWMRHELPPQKKQQILSVIEGLKKELKHLEGVR